jgi:hypothetical protein
VFVKKEDQLAARCKEAQAQRSRWHSCGDGMVEHGEKENDDDNQPSSKPSVKVEVKRNRVNESPWRHHFGKWFWDNSATLVAKLVVYLRCQV